ncbi:MAG TPA: hypothetical protein VKU92_02980 [Acidimicrobiales bacterium]|nr:hypothetical protein [Acidimicrobiales bacterium]
MEATLRYGRSPTCRWWPREVVQVLAATATDAPVEDHARFAARVAALSAPQRSLQVVVVVVVLSPPDAAEGIHHVLDRLKQL